MKKTDLLNMNPNSLDGAERTVMWSRVSAMQKRMTASSL